MITDLAKRRELWDRYESRGPEDGHDLSDSLPYPFEDAGIQYIFDQKRILEIGPGNGRQYERLRAKSQLYCIADISLSALKQPVFDGASEKFLITDWGQYLGGVFDVVHFWYVLHHIRRDEMRDFFSFVARHLALGGLAAFNCPQPINVQGSPEGDGLGTTYSNPKLIQSKAEGYLELLMASQINRCSTWYVFLMKKV